jgi:hypothetical protein
VGSVVALTKFSIFLRRGEFGAILSVVSYTHGKQFQADHRTDNWNLVEPLDYEIDDPLAGSTICRLDEETHSSPAVTNWSTVWSAIGQPPSAFL